MKITSLYAQGRALSTPIPRCLTLSGLTATFDPEEAAWEIS